MPGARSRRRKKNRRREILRFVLAGAFVLAELIGFLQANFAARDSWTELFGFLLLQPAQIALNLMDGHWRLTRGMSDNDAVMLITLVSMPLNCLLWYGVWRGWRSVWAKRRRRRRSVVLAEKPIHLARMQAGMAEQESRRFNGSRPTTSVAAEVMQSLAVVPRSEYGANSRASIATAKPEGEGRTQAGLPQ